MPVRLNNYRRSAKGQRKLTQEAARAVRLSPARTADLAREYGVSVTLIGQIREGRTYGPLQMDERAAQAARSGMADPVVEADFQCLHSLVVVPDPSVETVVRLNGKPVALATGLPVGSPSSIEPEHFADDECEHGRLPGDRTPACGCWPQEQTNPTRRTNGSNHHQPSGEHADRVARFAAQVHAGPHRDRAADDRAPVA